MTIATIYCLACLLAFLAAPVAFWAPVLLAVTFPVMAETEGRIEAPTHIETMTQAEVSATCAPAVVVYASRGPVSRRPTVHAWSVSPATPAPWTLSKNGRPLKGAARKSAIAKSTATYCRMGG